MKLTKQTIVVISIIADLLDFTPFHFAFIIDIAVIIIHYLYAGPRALWGIFDMIWGVGVLPIYTGLALSYKNKEEKVEEETLLPTPKQLPPQIPPQLPFKQGD